jgi:type IV pilus assembly protein PilO
MNELIARFAKIPLKQKVALLGVLYALMGAIFYFLVYSDQEDRKKTLAADLLRINAEKTKLALIAEEKAKFEKRLQELEDKRKKALALLPDDAQLEDLQLEFTRRAKQAQIRITKIVPLPQVPMGFYAKVPVQLFLEGTFHQLVVFFNLISEMRRIVNIQDPVFTDPRPREGQVLLQAQVLATSYRSLKESPQPAAGPKKAAPAPKPSAIQAGKQALKKPGKRSRKIEE